jgi:hypothetical protein
VPVLGAGSRTTAAGTAVLERPPVADHMLLGTLRRQALNHGLPAPMRIYRRSGWMVQNSAASAELLECVLAGGARWWAVWKRETRPTFDGDGCPTGVAYETLVYEQILAPRGYDQPRFLGGSYDASTGEDWLFVEFLQGAVRLPGFPPEIAGSAASWLAHFHRSFERSAMTPASSFVRGYDEPWYRDRIDRAMSAVSAAGRESTHVTAIADVLRRDLADLLAAPTTLIHGDFWTQNILIHGVAIRPIDWASAAIAPGEVDLATLTEGFGVGDEAALVERYRAARWPSKEEPGFEERYQAARAYSAIRRLSELSGWTPSADRDLTRLIDAAERLRLI